MNSDEAAFYARELLGWRRLLSYLSPGQITALLREGYIPVTAAGYDFRIAAFTHVYNILRVDAGGVIQERCCLSLRDYVKALTLPDYLLAQAVSFQIDTIISLGMANRSRGYVERPWANYASACRDIWSRMTSEEGTLAAAAREMGISVL